MSEASIASSGTPKLNKALSQLQGEMPKVTKTKTAEVKDQQTNRLLYKYDYADLGDVVADMGPLMARHGLAFHCAPTIDPANRNMMILSWSLLHESGEERSGEWPLGPVGQKPQTLGSMITYGRRYSFSAAINIVVEDDDDGQRAQRDYGTRQSAGDVWEDAKPARQNGSSSNAPRGQVSRPATTPKPAAAPAAADADGEIDADAQAFADEAHEAVTPNSVENIHKRAREAGKLLSLVRNPAADGKGMPGKLAVYLDWKRKQVKEAADALADLMAAADERNVADVDGFIKSVLGTDLEAATAAQMRTAARTLREKEMATT